MVIMPGFGKIPQQVQNDGWVRLCNDGQVILRNKNHGSIITLTIFFRDDIVDSDAKSNRKKGLPPGTPVYVGKCQPQPCNICLTQYDGDKHDVSNISDLSVLFDKINAFSGNQWISVSGLANAEVINSLCQNYKIHTLVIENIMNTTLRPTLETYDNYAFLSLKTYNRFHEENDDCYNHFSLIFLKNIIITFEQEQNNFFDIIRERLKNPNSRVRHSPITYLGYLFVDYIIDDYMCYLDKVADEIERAEDLLIAENKTFSVNNLYRARREISSLRKVTLPLYENINKITKAEVDFIEKQVVVFYKDLSEHCLRTIENCDSYRDTIASMFDIYLSQSNNKTNEIIRVLTIFASIFIPLTFISSLYGMNFENIPELDSRYGYYVVLAVMLLVASSLLVFFRRKKWI